MTAARPLRRHSHRSAQHAGSLLTLHGLGALALSAAACAGADSRRPGFDFMGPSTQAMQRDDSQNPAMLWVKDGEALWNTAAGESGKSCASCHGDATASMRGVATRHPAFDPRSGGALTLSQRIAACRTQRQRAPALAPESPALLGLESFVAMQSRGLTIAAPDPRLVRQRERGERLYTERIGQLGLSCAQCHDDNAGQRLAGNSIPQAHPTGYPIYRLEWQGLGSLQRRLRNCMSGVRAEPFAYGAPELVELELFLMWRARGMRLETPAVRP